MKRSILKGTFFVGSEAGTATTPLGLPVNSGVFMRVVRSL